MLEANVTIKTRENKETINWHSIDWRNVNKRVNNLRRRIYRASAMGDIKTVRNLQKLMFKSKSNKLCAIRRVTQVNQGKKSPGIDKIIVKTDKDRNLLLQQLANNNPTTVKPIKRVYIPKRGGKTRPLGLPTILDRCQQAIVKSALEPYWEAKFEGCSYGFRPGRSAHDAMQKIFCIANPRGSRPWVLDADIKGAFDNINHEHLLKELGNFPGRNWIKAWLQSGVMENYQFTSTISGTPQGGIISPLLSNIALHGMGNALGISYDKYERIKPTSEYALVRYADDFVIFAKSEEACIKSRQIIGAWLNKRGLELSEEKTQIRNIKEGFDFLGMNTRQYRTKRKRRGIILLSKPSKASIKEFKKRIIIEWKKGLSLDTKKVIEIINSKIKGWCSYYNKVCSKETFSALDHWMWTRQARYVARKHPSKHWWWLKQKYWGKIRGRNDRWVFMNKSKDKEMFLWKLAWTPIRRHILVKGSASPDNPTLKLYWHNRQAKKPKYLFKTNQILWNQQKGRCPICGDDIDNGEEVQIHHKKPRRTGGTDQIDNLVLLHTNCHYQVHSKKGQKLAEVSRLLEPYAG